MDGTDAMWPPPDGERRPTPDAGRGLARLVRLADAILPGSGTGLDDRRRTRAASRLVGAVLGDLGARPGGSTGWGLDDATYVAARTEVVARALRARRVVLPGARRARTGPLGRPAALTPAARAADALSYLEGLGPAEIAAVLQAAGVPDPGTAVTIADRNVTEPAPTDVTLGAVEEPPGPAAAPARPARRAGVGLGLAAGLLTVTAAAVVLTGGTGDGQPSELSGDVEAGPTQPDRPPGGEGAGGQQGADDAAADAGIRKAPPQGDGTDADRPAARKPGRSAEEMETDAALRALDRWQQRMASRLDDPALQADLQRWAEQMRRTNDARERAERR